MVLFLIGRLNVNVDHLVSLPLLSTLLLAHILPLCFSMIFLQMYRPSPVPDFDSVSGTFTISTDHSSYAAINDLVCLVSIYVQNVDAEDGSVGNAVQCYFQYYNAYPFIGINSHTPTLAKS